MSWNYNIDQAPRNVTRTVNLPVPKGEGTYERQLRVQVPILLTVGDEVITSHWDHKREHWSGVATGVQPKAWQPWPEAAP